MTEQWRPVPGYEDLYDVSDHGRVRSWYGRSGPRIRKATVDREGYEHIFLWKDGERKGFLVHRLVLAAFVGPCPDGMETRHLDGDAGNNRLTNICYGSHSENNRDKVRHGTDHNAAKTHCPHGHPYDEANTCLSNGRRYCRTCERIRTRKARARKRMAV